LKSKPLTLPGGFFSMDNENTRALTGHFALRLRV
jgi:hypothetical protein